MGVYFVRIDGPHSSALISLQARTTRETSLEVPILSPVRLAPLCWRLNAASELERKSGAPIIRPRKLLLALLPPPTSQYPSLPPRLPSFCLYLLFPNRIQFQPRQPFSLTLHHKETTFSIFTFTFIHLHILPFICLFAIILRLNLYLPPASDFLCCADQQPTSHSPLPNIPL